MSSRTSRTGRGIGSGVARNPASYPSVMCPSCPMRRCGVYRHRSRERYRVKSRDLPGGEVDHDGGVFGDPRPSLGVQAAGDDVDGVVGDAVVHRVVLGRVTRRHRLIRLEELSEGLDGRIDAAVDVDREQPRRREKERVEARVREYAITAARRAGARVIASGTSPLPVGAAIVGKPRYLKMVEHFGLTTTEQLTGACHVHVSIESDEEGVGVLDRIRGWLSVLLALSANSPFWQGEDTKYASFRSQAIVRWPTAGPTEVFGSAEAYHELVSSMIASGAILDEGMVYFDARLSHHYPTVEIRVADVCPDAADTVLIAALCRALVDTAAAEWREGEGPPAISVSMLRLMSWQAGRFGIEGDLIDPRTFKPRAAREVVADLIEHVRAALRDNGDEARVEEQVDRIFTRGNGAMRQRAVLEKTGQLSDVVADLATATAGLDA